jgi:hypothetical protein
MATPLLYHDPENELFMVHVPMEMNLPHEEQQRLIGQLVQEVMRSIPAEQRRGYMLQPQEIISYQTFIEKILETEGITPEVIARQREQSQLLQTLATASKDVVDELLKERADEIDETFFAMLHSLIEMAQEQDDEEQLLKLINLQARLYTDTEVGRELEKRQSALRRLQKEARKKEALTPEMLLDHVVQNMEDDATVDALIAIGQQAFNYEFFSLLTERIEGAAKAHDKERAKQLTTLRERLLDLQRELQEQSRKVLQQATDTLQAILDAEDTKAAINANLGRIDDTFMYVLSAMIAQAQQEGRDNQVVALKEVQNLIMEEAERQVPPEIRVVNKLLRAETEEAQRAVIEENLGLLSPRLVEVLDRLADELSEDGGGDDVIERVRKIKAMVAARL